MREVWSARVRGGGGLFERATLEIDDASGRFVLVTENVRASSYDRAEFEHEDVVRLAEVLEDELHRGPSS